MGTKPRLERPRELEVRQDFELDPKFVFMDTLMHYLRELNRPAQEANAFVQRYNELRAARIGEQQP